ncbi:MAG: hypothetical protein JRD68_16200 [Deltaproteobacteria bacterium]|nr:hypothetical protein [Deltaproteobacteria bacterium]
MKDYIRAPLLSGLVLPGLGQVVNEQIIKGLALMGVITFIFLALLVKLFIDLSGVMGEAMGPDLGLGPDTMSRIMEGMRERNLTLLYVLGGFGVAVWAFSIVDAFQTGRRKFKTDT